MPLRNELIREKVDHSQQKILKRLLGKDKYETCTVGEFLEFWECRRASAHPACEIYQHLKELVSKEENGVQMEDGHNSKKASRDTQTVDMDFPAIRLIPPESDIDKNRFRGINAYNLLNADYPRADALRHLYSLCEDYRNNNGKINGYQTVKAHVTLPTDLSDNATLFERIEKTIADALTLLAHNHYAANFTKKTGASKNVTNEKPTRSDYETIRVSSRKFINGLIDGTIGEEGYPNFIIENGLFDELETALKSSLYCPVATFEETIGCPEGQLGQSPVKEFINALDYDFSESSYSLNFICKRGETKILNNLYGALKSCLSKRVLPIPIDELRDIVRNCDDLRDIHDLDERFDLLLNSLEEVEITEVDGGTLVAFRGTSLGSDTLRIARILSEQPNPISKEHLLNLYKERYGKPYDNKAIRGKGITHMNDCYWFQPEASYSSFKLVKDFISTQTGTFTFDQVKEELLNRLPEDAICSDDSLRTYIMLYCCVCNDDNNLFCPIDIATALTNRSWRRKTKKTQERFYVFQIIDILQHNSVSRDSLITLLMERGEKNGYNNRKQTLDYIVAKYSNKDDNEHHILDLKDGIISLNKKKLSQKDMLTLGRNFGPINKKRVTPILLYTNTLLKREPKGLLLQELVDKINDEIYYDIKNPNKNATRNFILRTLEEFADNIEFYKDGYNLYVRLAADSLKPESSPNSNSPTANIGAPLNVTLDWDRLVEIAIKQMSMYQQKEEGWLQNVDLNNIIPEFFYFIKTSDNQYISDFIPMYLFKYWTYATDAYDRYGYFSTLAQVFESMLKDIVIRNEIELNHTTGIRELMDNYFTELSQVCYGRNVANTWLKRTIKGLTYNRNSLAHGDYIELNSSDVAKAILDYLALYIYAFHHQEALLLS